MMTPDEHQLVIEMFKNQTLVFAALVETLKSQGIVQTGDLAAYDEFVAGNEARRAALEQHVEEEYRRFAKVLGVTGLPSL
jgi:hypothetical protein